MCPSILYFAILICWLCKLQQLTSSAGHFCCKTVLLSHCCVSATPLHAAVAYAFSVETVTMMQVSEQVVGVANFWHVPAATPKLMCLPPNAVGIRGGQAAQQSSSIELSGATCNAAGQLTAVLCCAKLCCAVHVLHHMQSHYIIVLASLALLFYSCTLTRI